MNWQPLWLSFELALTTMLLLLLIAAPLAYFLAFTRTRGRGVLEAVFALPLVLPPTVLGYFLLVAIGGKSPAGQWYQAVFGSTFAFSFAGLVLASMLYSLPFAVQPMQNAFESLDRGLSEVSRTLGLNAWQSFFRVMLPGARVGVVTGAVLAFAHTVGEFGVVLMVGGSIPGKTKVASIAIYEHVENLEYHEANAMSLVLLAFSFVVLSVVYHYNRRLSRMVLG
ncbi:MAG: molybdate ABC transporter permease subunit [Mariprofundaceae bacterium]|nr:molybdate ABC transporter permease subunit [Mariprofundaceae bacterium]